MTDLLGIVGSQSQPSKTRSALEVALNAAEDTFKVSTGILHLAEYHIETADGRSMKEYQGDTAVALQKIADSRAFLIGTPVYRGSYSGALKNLLDLVPRGKWQAKVAPFENRAIGLIATGATNHHFLSVSQELSPILNFFGSYQVGCGVYVASEHFDEYEIIDSNVRNRLSNLGNATIELSKAIQKSDFLPKLGPQF